MAFDTNKPHAYPGFAAAIIIPDVTVAKTGSSAGMFTGDLRLRATSFNVQPKQEIQTPELIDGIVDRSGYSIGMLTVDGDIAFPLFHEGTGLAGLPASKASGCGTGITTTMASVLWQMAAARDEYQRLKYYFPIQAVYPDNLHRAFGGCVVNKASFKVAQGGHVEVTMSVIAGTNAEEAVADEIYPTYVASGSRYPTSALPDAAAFGSSDPIFLGPSRMVQWNDFALAFWSGGTAQLTSGAGIREFSCDINNNVERYATLNGKLTPQDVTARKRQINGTIKILGRNTFLNYMGITNQYRFTSDEQIAFGYNVGSDLYWATALHGLLYKIEEMQISPTEILETTVNYEAMGDCAFNYESTTLGTDSPTAMATTVPGIGTHGAASTTAKSNTPYTGWTTV